LVELAHPEISLGRQCELLGLARSSLYYQPRGESERNLKLLRLLDEQYTWTPFYGVPRMTAWLGTQGEVVNEKRVRRLLRVLGLEAIYPKPRLSDAAAGHKIYPYLLRKVAITRVNQVWSTDITYIRLRQGFIYLVAVIDWFSRYVLSWEVSGNDGVELLRGGAGLGAAYGAAEDLEHGPGLAVYLPGVYRKVVGPGHRDQHGW